MFKGIQIIFLLQYATVILVIFCILIVVDHKKTALSQTASLQPETDKELNVYSPELLKTELLINQLFVGQEVQSDKLESIVSLLSNHNIDLIVELNGQTEPVARIYAVSEALRQLGLNNDSFSINVLASSSVAVDDAKVRLSWSKL